MGQQFPSQVPVAIIEIDNELSKWHGQHGLDAYAECESRLGNDQIPAGGHAKHDIQFRVRQLLVDAVEKGGHGTAGTSQIALAKLRWPSHADDERGAHGRGALGGGSLRGSTRYCASYSWADAEVLALRLA